LGGEIIVTAQRRSENIQNVGIAISAYSGDQLRALNVVDSRDIAALTPGVHLGGAIAGQNSQYTIRGVTQNDFNDIVEAPNAVYLDDGYIAIGQGQTFALFDIDRVEVLKGPQGTWARRSPPAWRFSGTRAERCCAISIRWVRSAARRAQAQERTWVTTTPSPAV